MKIMLKPFQVEAVDRIVNRLRQASQFARSGDLQSVSFTSPTGSGKTVMATAAIERLIEGDEVFPPDPEATFLWISDQPELNEQTRRKMLTASTILGPTRLRVIESSFDSEVFAAGTVSFLNIQKLGKETHLVTYGDERRFRIWDTVANTARIRAGSFYVFIDEAHRGMAENPRARGEATTIIQKFIKGSPGEILPVTLVVGISATPERFNRLVEGTERTILPVPINPEEVRASGLLKEVITFYHPQEEQSSDMTMLRAAARSWRAFCTRWDAYCTTQGEPLVRPLLVVQVQDSTGKQLSRTDLSEAISVIQDEVGPLPSDAFAHAFQEGRKLAFGAVELRYLAPPDIEADPDVQVVFFKTSLNTGWDCPRAEVMMSFRTAVDDTTIAQLVGRMVRTPLARRIDVDEHLNTVALYLPHYNEAGLQKVVQRLTLPDPEIMPPVTIAPGENVVTLVRRSGSEPAFAALAQLPSYIVPRPRKSSELRRLMKLGRLLAYDDLDADSPDRASEILLQVLSNAYERAKPTERFKKIVDEKGKLDVRAWHWQPGTGATDGTEDFEQYDIARENIEDLFETAGRKLGEGLHKAWWRARVRDDATAKTTAKLELFALTDDNSLLEALQSTAKTTVQQWLDHHRTRIASLPEPRQQEYIEVRRLASDPEVTQIIFPEAVELSRGSKQWRRHLYVDDSDLFPATLNSWETRVIEEELSRSDVVGWLRNVDRKPWALCVPYRMHGEHHPLYPDFLVLRLDSGELVVDIIDPHLSVLEDASYKAAGLAEYAAKHAHMFGRIQLVIVEGEEVRRLDLCKEGVREKVRAVTSNEHLRQQFDLLAPRG